MFNSIPRHEVRYNDWSSAHRPMGSKEGYGDNHTQYGTNPDGSTYEVRPWKHPDNPEFAKLNPEYARLLRQQRDQRSEEARTKARQEVRAPVSKCPPIAPLSPAAKEVIKMEQHLQKIREGKIKGGSVCGISTWELLAQQAFLRGTKIREVAAKKAAEDQAWLSEVQARTAAKNSAEVETGVMQERQGPGYSLRVRRQDGAGVADALADQAAEAASTLLSFFRGELMSAMLSKMPRAGSAPGRGRAEITAYRRLSNAAQALERGRADGWHETHELKLTLDQGCITVSYHSKYARLSPAQLEKAGYAEVAAALQKLEILGVALHLEPR